MKKLLMTIGCVGVIICAGVLPVYAIGPTATGTPEIFEMTFTKLTMVKEDGTVVVVNDTPATVDLANANPNELIGKIMGGDIVTGVYTQINSTVSMTVTMKGAVQSGALIYYTTATTATIPPQTPGENDGQGCECGIYDTGAPGAEADLAAWFTAGSPAQGMEDPYAAVTLRPPETDPTHTTPINGREVIAAGDVVEETMEIDVSGALEVWDMTGVPTVGEVVMFPGIPQINVQ